MRPKYNWKNNLIYVLYAALSSIVFFINDVFELIETSVSGISFLEENLPKIEMFFRDNSEIFVLAFVSVFFIGVILFKRGENSKKRAILLSGLKEVSNKSLWLSQILWTGNAKLHDIEAKYRHKILNIDVRSNRDFVEHKIREYCSEFMCEVNDLFQQAGKEIIEVIKNRVELFLGAYWGQRFEVRVVWKSVKSNQYDGADQEINLLLDKGKNLASVTLNDFFVHGFEVDSASRPDVMRSYDSQESGRRYVSSSTALEFAISSAEKVFCSINTSDIDNYAAAPQFYENGYNSKMVVPVYRHIGVEKSFTIDGYLTIFIKNFDSRPIYSSDSLSDPIVNHVKCCAVHMAHLAENIQALKYRILTELVSDRLYRLQAFHNEVDDRKAG